MSARRSKHDRIEGRRQVLILAGLFVAGTLVVWSVARSNGQSDETATDDHQRVRVIRRIPHDTSAFTQGLLLHEGKLYESTGQYGRSSLRRVSLSDGGVEQEHTLPADVFAEGLARVGDRLIQLTWREGKAFVWDIESFEQQAEFSYPGEGWGLCYDGDRLIMSTGSDRLVFRDPDSFRKLGEVRVLREARPVRKLNELACVDGFVFANVWEEDVIIKIDPGTGRVVTSIDASGLLPAADRMGGEDVLNGIAFLPESGHFLLTGKNWPYMYEVEFVGEATN